MNKDEIRKTLLEIAKKEIRISYKKPGKPLPATSGKFGGRPAVQQGFEWPYYTGKGREGVKTRPLALTARINLADVAGLDEENLLPKSGILSFFYDLGSETMGFRPDDKGSALVYYFPDESQLSPVDLPDDLDEEYKIPELAMVFTSQISLPRYQDFDERVDLDGKDYDWETSTRLAKNADTSKTNGAITRNCSVIPTSFRIRWNGNANRSPEDIPRRERSVFRTT